MYSKDEINRMNTKNALNALAIGLFVAGVLWSCFVGYRDIMDIGTFFFSLFILWLVAYVVYWILIKPRISGVVAIGEELG